jgi:hypothetical protein
MDNPITSTTQLALDSDISQSSVVRILKKNKHKPYKMHLLFCAIMMEMINNNPDCLIHILFSDEATFCLNGFVNRHSCRYWSSENPHWMTEHHTQHPQKMSGMILLGTTYFIDGNLTAERNLTADRYLNL